jgi:RecJ-like exonuclease
VEERGNTYVMSLRANSKEINLDRVLREVTPHLGGSGGGHPSAAGARIPKHQFMKLIQVLNERLGWISDGDD